MKLYQICFDVLVSLDKLKCLQVTMNSCSDILKDFESGPLDFYRKHATIDWKKMRVFIESEEVLKYKVNNNFV